MDPGIDHLTIMRIVDQCHERGEEIIEFESWCGGLPSPEYCNNPLGYKLTWSPIGALLSHNNDAILLKNNKVIEVKGKDLLYHAKTIEINQLLTLEGYPNRDST